MSDFPPPSNQPFNDILPPPPPPRSSSGDGCWKWGGISCGLGCLSLAILIAAVFVIVMPQIKPLFSECMKLESDVSIVQQEMKAVLRAIDRYREAKGRYPSSLEELLPKYISDRSELKFSQNQPGPVFKYTAPTGQSDDTPILEYALTYRLLDNRTIPIPVRLTKRGDFDTVAVPDQCRALQRSRID
jgi:hypothetical protein